MASRFDNKNKREPRKQPNIIEDQDNEPNTIRLNKHQTDLNNDILPNNRIDDELTDNSNYNSNSNSKELTENIFDIVKDKNNVNIDFYKEAILSEKLEEEKNTFIVHLQKKIDSIELRMRYINHKYTDYVKSYKNLNGTVIICSSTLTLFEASTLIIDYELITSMFFRNFFILLPLLISTLVSLLATLIKFQKYQEHMESLIVTEEKGIIAISKLKKIREQVYFEKKDISSIKELYLSETYEFYNEVNIKISIELDEEDYMRYYKKMSKVDVNIGNTYLRKTRDINTIIDEHTYMEKQYKKNEFDGNDSDDDIQLPRTPRKSQRQPSVTQQPSVAQQPTVAQQPRVRQQPTSINKSSMSMCTSRP